MAIKEVLKELCLATAPSGAEADIYPLCERSMGAYGNCTTDARGNFLCTKEGEGTHFLLDAHLDQIGFIVTSIEEGGFLKVAKAGGMDRRVAPSHEVIVLAEEPFFGVIGCKPPHLTEESERKKAPKIEELFIDTGLSEEALKARVCIGDRVIYRPHFEELLGDTVTGTSVDDRAGMAIIIRVMELLKANASDSKVTAVFSVQEEVNGKGAGNASYYTQADEAVVVDVSFASQPEVAASKKSATMPMGGGAFIGFAPILNRDISKGFVRVATEKGIPFRVEAMGGRTGTNADEVASVGIGTKTVTISPPIRNMHTPVEVVSLGDLENCARLIAAYILQKEGKSCIF